MVKDEGVSVVIGVVLILAITVVLAAVIAVYTFDMSNSLPDSKNIFVNVERVNSSCIYIMTIAGDDLRNLAFDPPGTLNGNSGQSGSSFYGVYNVTINGIEMSNLVPDGTTNCTSKVGSMQYFTPVQPGSQVDVIANFKDGSRFVAWSGEI